MSEFRVQKSGFQIVLNNNYTVSVQFSEHHYCSSRHGEQRDAVYGLVCSNAEVAVRDSDGEFVPLQDGDNVKGWQSVSEVIALINKFNQLEGEV